MKKDKHVYIEYIYFGTYNKKKYFLANRLGRELVDFLGDKIFTLLLDSEILMFEISRQTKEKTLFFPEDRSYELLPAAKAFEGFLEKIAIRKRLRINSNEKIGNIFDINNQNTLLKVKDKNLLKKINITWNLCRNEILHFNALRVMRFGSTHEKYREILDAIIETYKCLYHDSQPDNEINEGYKRYCKTSQTSIRTKLKIISTRFIYKVKNTIAKIIHEYVAN